MLGPRVQYILREVICMWSPLELDYYKYSFYEFNIVGVTFDGRQDAIAELREDDILEVRIVDTPHGYMGKGVQVWIGGKHIGWMPDNGGMGLACQFRQVIRRGYEVVGADWKVVGGSTKGVMVRLKVAEAEFVSITQ